MSLPLLLVCALAALSVGGLLLHGLGRAIRAAVSRGLLRVSVAIGSLLLALCGAASLLAAQDAGARPVRLLDGASVQSPARPGGTGSGTGRGSGGAPTTAPGTSGFGRGHGRSKG